MGHKKCIIWIIIFLIKWIGITLVSHSLLLVKYHNFCMWTFTFEVTFPTTSGTNHISILSYRSSGTRTTHCRLHHLAAGAPDLAAVGTLEPPTLAVSHVPTVGCPADDGQEEKHDLVAVVRKNLASSANEASASHAWCSN
jgi:hypothetical protein